MPVRFPCPSPFRIIDPGRSRLPEAAPEILFMLGIFPRLPFPHPTYYVSGPHAISANDRAQDSMPQHTEEDTDVTTGPARRRLLVLEAILAVVLLGALVTASDISGTDLRRIAGSFAGWTGLTVLILTSVQVYLSADKWAYVLRHHDTHVQQSRRFYFFHTATGMLLGQILPTQIGTAATRAIALKTQNDDKPLATGAYTSVYEQSFDIAVPLAMLPASVAALVLGWPPLAWLSASVASVVIATSLGGRVLELISHRSGSLRYGPVDFSVIAASLSAKIVRALAARSAVRYVAVLLRCAVVANACGCDIGAWVVVMIAPAIQCLAVLSITPGALGVVEWGWAGLLNLHADVPIAQAAMLALSLRLTFLASLIALVLALRLTRAT
jgi:Lysylphosphatidylglycerol synthase TM region